MAARVLDLTRVVAAQAAGGLMAMTGFPDGPPVRGGGALADFVGGLYLALGIVAALRERDRAHCASRTPSRARALAPELGEHNAEVYAELGLAAAGVV